MIVKKTLKSIFRLLGYDIELNPLVPSSFDADYKRLETNITKYSSPKLHFGCGPRVLKDWINIDLSYVPYESYLKYYGDEYYPENLRGDKNDFYSIDITKTGLPIPDNSVDVVFHEDFLEHLTQHQQIIFLAETFRVMKKGSIHRVNTPNLITSMQVHSSFAKGFSGVYNDEWKLYGHHAVLTPALLKEYALMIGYSRVDFTAKNHSTCKSLPKEYRPTEDRDQESGNIFADLIK